MNKGIVEFTDWEKVLKDTVPSNLQAGYHEAIQKFRYWLWDKGKISNVEAFKEHLAWKKSYLKPESFEIRRQALRWYYDRGYQKPIEEATSNLPPRTVNPANRQTIMSMNDVPSLGRVDLGGPPWERALVARIRELHLAWKTEKTYRHWAWRFIRFCDPKQSEELSHEDVRRWLSYLAVEGRVAAGTQKQALNAVVFCSGKVSNVILGTSVILFAQGAIGMCHRF